jgi:CRISPR/Cas system CSM-associated protein Csm4 (group 5 of RAMP superfamily)
VKKSKGHIMKIVYLTPKSLFPTSLQSDTIFGAICVGLKEIYGVDELTEMLGLFNDGTIPFILSISTTSFQNQSLSHSRRL